MSVLSQVPNNDAIRKRLAARSNGIGLPNALGDYPADLPNRILFTKGYANTGPVTAPTIEGPKPEDTNSVLREIRDLLARMPYMLSDEFRTRFIVTPREAVAFINPGGTTTVPAGTALAIVSQLIPEQYTGFLTHVGVGVVPAGAFASITWQIRVNGAIHPMFFNRIFSASSIGGPTPFPMELTQNRTVELVAINGAAVPIDVAGVLVGWTEFMSTNKRYGSSPETGIA